ncbi:aldo/keto reductase [Cohnella massiliensis]|uniref:aldo/keto reductase n=1 Tax=Cohnella massiliensis TaxID=1816691 RepID=UPI0015944374|nr:aldo/keto reductase [Cohnella massiliensis]
MNKLQIRGTELRISQIGLGSALFGSKISRGDAFRLMDLYADRGGNMADTAEVYANWLPDTEPSASEKTIGEWMKARGNRNRLVVTTKGAHPRTETMSVGRMSEAEVREDVEGSLRRLQVTEIDLYWLHRDDTARGAGEIVEMMNGFVREGKIRCFGCSNWTVERMREAQAYAEARGLRGFCANQMMWSLAAADKSRLADPSLVPMDEAMYELHRETGLAAIPYSSQAQGVFTKWEEGTHAEDDERIAAQYRSADNVARWIRASRLAAELSLPLNRIVLGYLLSQPFPTIPIVGPNTPGQLLDSLEAAETKLTPEQLAWLDKGEA